ncbi:MAG: hypothetical protein RL120_16700, partial [Gammaproteobacteria bacterium]
MSVVSDARANTFMQLSVGANNEDNVPRGLDAFHTRDDNYLSAGFTLGKLFQPTLNSQLTLSGSLGTDQHADLDGWDRHSASVAIDYGYKLGFGAYAPRLGANFSISRDYLQGTARDVESSLLQLSYSRRLSPAWWMELGADYQVNDTAALQGDPAL